MLTTSVACRYPKLTKRFTPVTDDIQKVLLQLMPSAQHLYFWIGRLAPPNKPFEFELEEFRKYSGYCDKQCKRALDQLIEAGLVKVIKMYWPAKRYMLASYTDRLEDTNNDEPDEPDNQQLKNLTPIKEKRTKFQESSKKSPKEEPETTQARGSIETNKETATPTHPVENSQKEEKQVNPKAGEAAIAKVQGTEVEVETQPPEPSPEVEEWLERILLQAKKLGVIVSGRLLKELMKLTREQISRGLMALKDGRNIRNATGYFLSACRGTWAMVQAPVRSEVEYIKKWITEKKAVASREERDGIWVAVGTIAEFKWYPFSEALRILGT